MKSSNLKHIESREGVFGGKPCVAGTRMRVRDISVQHEVRGMPPDNIVAQHPELSLTEKISCPLHSWDRGNVVLFIAGPFRIELGTSPARPSASAAYLALP